MEITERETGLLSGLTLDWAVATALGEHVELRTGPGGVKQLVHFPDGATPRPWSPSTIWAQGGPVLALMLRSGAWLAQPYRVGLNDHLSVCNFDNEGILTDHSGTTQRYIESHGIDLLVATCRALAMARLGDRISVPVELVSERA